MFDTTKMRFPWFIVVCMIIITCNISLGYGELGVVFDESTIFSERDPILVQASAGAFVRLEVNGVFEGEQVVPIQAKEINVGTLQNEIIQLGQQVTLANTRATPVSILIDGVNTTLGGGEKRVVPFQEVKDYEIVKGDQKVIFSVVDEKQQIEFTGIEYQDGINTVVFLLRRGAETSREEFSILVNKNEVTISILEQTEVVGKAVKRVNIQGSTTQVAEIYYKLGEAREFSFSQFERAEVLDRTFNITFDSDFLKQGNNTISIFAVQRSGTNFLIKGKREAYVFADFQDPFVRIVGETYQQYTNQPVLAFEVETDGIQLITTFNGKNQTFEVINQSVPVKLSLAEGRNNITLIAVDRVGNIGKLSQEVILDTRQPELVELLPEDLFDGGEAHFPIQKIEGKINKPNVELIALSLQDDGKANCQDYASSLFELDEAAKETEITLDPALLLQRREVDVGSDGEFEIFLGLVGKQVSARVQDGQVESVATKTKVCFLMKDFFNNVNVVEKSVTLNTGNTAWKASPARTTPNTLFAAEIEQGKAQTQASSKEFGMTIKFDYVGASQVTRINSINIDLDGSDGDNAFAEIDQTRTHYFLDKSTGELLVHVPVRIRPLGVEAIKYPGSFDFRFKASVSYVVADGDVPVDTINPVFFIASLNVEKPFDNAKWLTPKRIDQVVKILNTTIEVTEQLTEFFRWGSVAGLVGCTAAQAFYAASLTTGGTGDALISDERDLYRICDRVYCLPSPPECASNNQFNLNEVGDYGGQTIKNQQGQSIAKLNSVQDIGASCEFGTAENKRAGNRVKISASSVEESDSFLGRNVFTKTDSTQYETEICVPAGEEIDLGEALGVCYNEQAPYFDDTKCFLPGLGGKPGYDSSSNILESIRCGCLPDTYSHLSKWLSLQQSLRGCLQQAKLGQVEGSYCERLLGMAVCDVAVNILLKQVIRDEGSVGSVGDRVRQPFEDFSSYFGEVQDNVQQRYKDSALGKKAISVDQISEKACIASISGDWSSLSQNILSSLEHNQVEPSFGPPLPSSQVQGYDPITGKLSIEYRFTYGVVSGGQSINSKFELVCDRGRAGGDNCPQNVEVKEAGSRVIAPGQSASETIVIVDQEADFWYNVLRVTHEYEVDGQKRTGVQEPAILQKGELPLECSFSIGLADTNGFSCQTRFGSNTLLSPYTIQGDSFIMPKSPTSATNAKSTLYLGSDIILALHYAAQSQDFDASNFKIVYAISLRKQNDELARIVGKSIPVESFKQRRGFTEVKIIEGKELVEGLAQAELGVGQQVSELGPGPWELVLSVALVPDQVVVSTPQEVYDLFNNDRYQTNAELNYVKEFTVNIVRSGKGDSMIIGSTGDQQIRTTVNELPFVDPTVYIMRPADE